tara:strand:- start:3272 stop:3592 length:321 start_codon:yes stop_codon:yes gene_type:complete
MSTKKLFIESEQLRHTMLCLDTEIAHLRNMTVLYRKMELMDETNSWVNGYGPWQSLMKIRQLDPETKIKSDIQDLNDSITRKEQMWAQLIREVENECSSDTYETKH